MTYSKDTLRQIFQQPFNQQEWQTMLHKYFHAKDLRAEPERINNTPLTLATMMVKAIISPSRCR
jgi:hypothetical protein